VLVLSPDRCFRASCAALLARRDCAVFTAASAGEAGELWAVELIDVLLVERTAEPAGFDDLLAWIRTGDPHACPEPDGVQRRAPAAVVVVCDGPPGGAPRQPPVEIPELPKWAPFEEIYAAIAGADGRRAVPPAGEHRGWLRDSLERMRRVV
jgi:hypothetical protein